MINPLSALNLTNVLTTAKVKASEIEERITSSYKFRFTTRFLSEKGTLREKAKKAAVGTTQIPLEKQKFTQFLSQTVETLPGASVVQMLPETFRRRMYKSIEPHIEVLIPGASKILSKYFGLPEERSTLKEVFELLKGFKALTALTVTAVTSVFGKLTNVIKNFFYDLKSTLLNIRDTLFEYSPVKFLQMLDPLVFAPFLNPIFTKIKDVIVERIKAGFEFITNKLKSILTAPFSLTKKLIMNIFKRRKERSILDDPRFKKLTGKMLLIESVLRFFGFSPTGKTMLIGAAALLAFQNSPFIQSIKKVIDDILKPIKDRLKRLEKELNIDERFKQTVKTIEASSLKTLKQLKTIGKKIDKTNQETKKLNKFLEYFSFLKLFGKIFGGITGLAGSILDKFKIPALALAGILGGGFVVEKLAEVFKNLVSPYLEDLKQTAVSIFGDPLKLIWEDIKGIGEKLKNLPVISNFLKWLDTLKDKVFSAVGNVVESFKAGLDNINLDFILKPIEFIVSAVTSAVKTILGIDIVSSLKSAKEFLSNLSFDQIFDETKKTIETLTGKITIDVDFKSLFERDFNLKWSVEPKLVDVSNIPVIGKFIEKIEQFVKQNIEKTGDVKSVLTETRNQINKVKQAAENTVKEIKTINQRVTTRYAAERYKLIRETYFKGKGLPGIKELTTISPQILKQKYGLSTATAKLLPSLIHYPLVDLEKVVLNVLSEKTIPQWLTFDSGYSF